MANKLIYIDNKLANIDNKLLFQTTDSGPSFDEVTIGTQTWMAKNLDIDDGGTGITSHDNVISQEGTFSYGKQYYYTWNAAKRIADSISGWHLPSYNEWTALFSTVGGENTAGKKLKSTSGWEGNYNGTDNYDFSVLPLGYGSGPGQVGYTAQFWSNTQAESYKHFITEFDFRDKVRILDNDDDGLKSVRLIKD